MKTVLITGVAGFVGRNTAQKFKKEGWKVVGLGRGSLSLNKRKKIGIDHFIKGEVNQTNLFKIKDRVEVIVHCAGSGVVSKSFDDPLKDFNDSVGSTAEVLDYMRQKQPKSKLVFTSGATVYGLQKDVPLKEDMILHPASPYGSHKIMAENLCELYSRTYGLGVTVIRFFSLYGPGLKKQLIWDACCKLTDPSSKSAVFWGTGEETRDWFNISDAVDLIYQMAQIKNQFNIINAGSAVRITLRETIMFIKNLLGSSKKIIFNGEVKVGDPRHFWADITQASKFDWKPKISWPDGFTEYVKWYTRNFSKYDL